MTPVVRHDVVDYFPQTRMHYPGYIKQEIFRVKLKDVLEEAYMRSQCAIDSVRNRGLEMRAVNNGPFAKGPSMTVLPDNRPSMKSTPTDPSWSTSFKAEVLKGVRSTEWRPVYQMRDYAAEMRAQSNQYFATAGKTVALHYGGGALARQAQKVGGKQISKLIAQEKLSKNMGEKVGKTVFGNVKLQIKYNADPIQSHSIKDLMALKLQQKKHTITIINGSLSDEVIGKTLDAATDSLSDGIEVSLNNENTRAWLTKHTGMSDKVAGYVMGGLDIASDFVPVAAATKTVEEAVFNVGFGVYYRIQAAEFERRQRESEERWKDFERKLKAAIVQDIEELSDKELLTLKDLVLLKTK